MKSSKFKRYWQCKCKHIIDIPKGQPIDYLCTECGRPDKWDKVVLRWERDTKWFNPLTWQQGRWIKANYDSDNNMEETFAPTENNAGDIQSLMGQIQNTMEVVSDLQEKVKEVSSVATERVHDPVRFSE